MEHVADMVATMRSHMGLAPLQPSSCGGMSTEAQEFAAAHETLQGAPLVLYVDRSPGDARALRNSDAVHAALQRLANVARVRFEGMPLRQQMVACEAADIFVSVIAYASFVNQYDVLSMILLLQVHGCDATNIMFMRPGSVAVTVTIILAFASCSHTHLLHFIYTKNLYQIPFQL